MPISTAFAGPNDIYVDGSLVSASCTNYSVVLRACGNGTERAFRTIAAAAAVTAPGNIVHIRQGTYSERLTPPANGTASQPITFQGYGSETATLTGTQGLLFQGRSYIIIDRLRVSDVSSWGQAYDSHHITIQNSTFERASSGGTTGGFKFVRSNDNRVLDSRFEDGNDNLMLIHADRNLISGNTLLMARHNTWGILCGNYNVIRNNDFDNPTQKLGQITDCEGVPSDAAESYDDTKRNLVEGNVFRRTGQAAPSAPYNGIQYAGQQGIIRRNVFHGNTGTSISMTIYANEARYNYGNRIYHNTMFGGHHAALDLAGSGGTFSDNKLMNNIMVGTIMTGYASELEGRPVQVLLAGRTSGFVLDTNNLFGTAPNQQYVITNGSRNDASGTQRTVAEWQAANPTLFVGNLDRVPGFQNSAGGDFRLSATSLNMDAGTWLARAVSAGSGTVITVDDVLPFYDGFGITGEAGDEVQFQGQTERGRITRIDYAARTLTIDRALTWSAGLRLSLAYAGSAPDIGAFESGTTTTTPPPAAPTNVRIIR
uniref:Fibronectin n=1 Tax=uncultured bacterium lac193 TaxID=1447243 RepID=X2LCP7_9BACT|nr:fibronectin [uncultured bacterium lac193]